MKKHASTGKSATIEFVFAGPRFIFTHAKTAARGGSRK
jgi:hypothetical protein